MVASSMEMVAMALVEETVAMPVGLAMVAMGVQDLSGVMADVVDFFWAMAAMVARVKREAMA